MVVLKSNLLSSKISNASTLNSGTKCSTFTPNTAMCFTQNRVNFLGNQPITPKLDTYGFHITILFIGPVQLSSAAQALCKYLSPFECSFLFLEPSLGLSLILKTFMNLKWQDHYDMGGFFLCSFFHWECFQGFSMLCHVSFFHCTYKHITTFIIWVILSIHFYSINCIHIVVKMFSPFISRIFSFSPSDTVALKH